jgi:hypothetical protein
MSRCYIVSYTGKSVCSNQISMLALDDDESMHSDAYSFLPFAMGPASNCLRDIRSGQLDPFGVGKLVYSPKAVAM